MRVIYVVHILAGILVVFSGYVALYATKEATLHRKAGTIRILPLLALPVVLVLVTMFYWLWRIRVKRSLRGLVGVSAPLGGTT